MMTNKSQFVCGRDGLTVHQWGVKGGWKHCASGSTNRSCGKRPLVVRRDEYEHEMAEFVSAAREAVMGRI